MTGHFIYTRLGAADMMDLKDEVQVAYHVKKAEKLGVKTSELKGGVEYFDVDRLKYPEDYIELNEDNFIQEKPKTKEKNKPSQKVQLSFSF